MTTFEYIHNCYAKQQRWSSGIKSGQDDNMKSSSTDRQSQVLTETHKQSSLLRSEAVLWLQKPYTDTKTSQGYYSLVILIEFSFFLILTFFQISCFMCFDWRALVYIFTFCWFFRLICVFSKAAVLEFKPKKKFQATMPYPRINFSSRLVCGQVE